MGIFGKKMITQFMSDKTNLTVLQLIAYFIIGYIMIPFNLVAAASILILSEVVGIAEELV